MRACFPYDAGFLAEPMRGTPIGRLSKFVPEEPRLIESGLLPIGYGDSGLVHHDRLPDARISGIPSCTDASFTPHGRVLRAKQKRTSQPQVRGLSTRIQASHRMRMQACLPHTCVWTPLSYECGLS